MSERPKPQIDLGIPKYPIELAHRYGAKAGILMYIATELPDIPQAPMIVSEPWESTDALLARADGMGILWPRVFRSSAIAELTGYEGAFPTYDVDDYEAGHERVRWNKMNFSMYRDREYFQGGVRDIVDKIRTSPKKLKKRGVGVDELPDEINVIVAERSPSKFSGTYIKLPNRDGAFLVSMTDNDSPEQDRDREDYLLTADEGLNIVRKNRNTYMPPIDAVEADIREVASWHDRIADLPEMDKGWAYQVEFGMDPLCLYQVRPFRPVEKANFTVSSNVDAKVLSAVKPIVIGVTPKKGVVARVFNFASHRYRDTDDLRVINGEVNLFNGDLLQARKIEDIPNVGVALLSHQQGLLSHVDVKFFRQAPLTVLFNTSPFYLREGERVRVISDGVNINVKPI